MDTKKLLASFLAEDTGRGDITGRLVQNRKITARIVCRQEAIMAGARFARQIFEMHGCRTRILGKDGSKIKPGQTVLTVSGNARSVLKCERTALNLMSRMSGIATETDKLVKMIKKENKKAGLYSTRKTAPGLRYFDREAVAIGGGKKHRLSLSDMVMIKDNHIASEGSMIRLIQKAKKNTRAFEVEVEDISDAILAASLGAPIIMLDNFSPDRIKKTISVLKKLGLRKMVRLEASGGINSGNIKRFARTGVEMISVGAITNSARAVDFSLEVE